MAFNFASSTKRMFGDTDELHVPIGDLIGAQFGEGNNETLLSIGSKWMQRFANQSMLSDEEEEKRFGPMVPPEVLNIRYGDSGIKFDEPTRDGFAKQRAEARRSFNNRQQRIASYVGGLPGTVAGFGARILGSIANPVDLAATVYFPSLKGIGQGARLLRAGRMGKAMSATFRQQPITDRLDAVWQGAVGNAAFEIPNFIEQKHLQTGYTQSDVIMNLGFGGLLGMGVSLGVRGYKRSMGQVIDESSARIMEMNPQEREAMWMGMLDAKMKGRVFNAEPHLHLSNRELDRVAEWEESYHRMNLLVDAAELSPNKMVRFNGGLNEDMLTAVAAHNAARIGGDVATEIATDVGVIMRTFDPVKKNKLLLELAQKNSVTYTESATQFPVARRVMDSTEKKARAQNVKGVVFRNSDAARVELRDGTSVPIKIKRGSVVNKDTGKKVKLDQVTRVLDENFRPISDIESAFDPHKSLRPYQEEAAKRRASNESDQLKKAAEDIRENGEDIHGRTPDEKKEMHEDIENSKGFDDAQVTQKDPDISNLPNQSRVLKTIKEESAQIAEGLDPVKVKAVKEAVDKQVLEMKILEATQCLAI